MERSAIPTLQAEEHPSRGEIIQKLQTNKNSVSIFVDLVPTILTYFQSKCRDFKAGQVSDYFKEWTELTSDKDILSTIYQA